MTNGNGIKIALLGFVLAPIFANATTAVSCYPKIHFQGEVATVSVERGVEAVPASFKYGNLQGSQNQNYVVNKSESEDLRYSYYQGKGFLLAVDTTNATAILKANLGNKVIHMSGLVCDFNEFDHHPGVTMSN